MFCVDMFSFKSKDESINKPARRKRYISSLNKSALKASLHSCKEKKQSLDLADYRRVIFLKSGFLVEALFFSFYILFYA